MTKRLIFKAALAVFILVGLGVLVTWDPSDDVSAASGAQATGQTASPKVIAYYFHTTYRCPSCMKIEAYSREAIESAFAKELKDGSVQWRVINVEQSANRHYINDYMLFSKSVILVRMNNGKEKRWKNLPKVWQLLGNKGAFMRYVQDELRSYLEAS